MLKEQQAWRHQKERSSSHSGLIAELHCKSQQQQQQQQKRPNKREKFLMNNNSKYVRCMPILAIKDMKAAILWHIYEQKYCRFNKPGLALVWRQLTAGDVGVTCVAEAKMCSQMVGLLCAYSMKTRDQTQKRNYHQNQILILKH
jgi:hypothetical protein